MLYLPEQSNTFMSLMEQLLRNEYQEDHSIESELVLQGFGTESHRDLLRARQWNRFQRTCRNLTRMGAVSVIVRFMCGVFRLAPGYDRAKFCELLEEIPVSPNQTAAQLCNDFFLLTKDTIIPVPCDTPCANAYTAEGQVLEDFKNYYAVQPGTVTKQLAVYLPDKLYGLQLDLTRITLQDVDRLAEAVLRQTREELDRNRQENAAVNAHMAEVEAFLRDKGSDMSLFRHPELAYSEFELRCAVPGGLLELYRACELAGRREICTHIMEAWVWPVFALVPWEQGTSDKTQIMGILLENYLDFFYLQCMSDELLLTERRCQSRESDWRIWNELTGQAGDLFQIGRAKYGQCTQMACAMMAAAQRGKGFLQKWIGKSKYSFLMSFTPYLLFCTGCEREAVEFLAENYEEISLYDRMQFYVQVLLSRCILKAERLETAYTLYGRYSYEMACSLREQGVRRFMEETIQYIELVKEYIRQSNEHTLDTGRSWYDLLFEDGSIDQVLSAVRDACDRKLVPAESEYRELMNIVEAFSYPYGIRLKLLRLPDQDCYDKLENALSPALCKQGQGYLNRRDEYDKFYANVRLLEINRNAAPVLQHRLSELAEATLEDSLRRIKEIKESRSAGKQDDSQTEHLLDEVIQDLCFQMSKGYLRREKIEQSINRMEQRFIEAYCPDRKVYSLLPVLQGKMEREVRNYLITAETVYQMLSMREDQDELDFSAALIPLTKALELVLSYVYTKIWGNIHRDTPDGDKWEGNYYPKSKSKKAPRKNVELGSLIYLFRDYEKATVKDERGKRWLAADRLYRHIYFYGWRVDEVVDISRLRWLAGKEVKIDGYKLKHGRSKPVTLSFGSDDVQNRMLLAEGLDYIRNNHRNAGAHKDIVSLTTASECRDFLLQTEDMLWILLMLLR